MTRTVMPLRMRGVIALAMLSLGLLVSWPAQADEPATKAAEGQPAGHATGAPATETPAAGAQPGHATPTEGAAGEAGKAGEAGDTHDTEKHEVHDPFDLTHNNATSELTTPREMRFDHLIGSWAVFLLLLGIVGKLGWKPIMNGLQKREESIAAKIDEAARNAAASEQRLQEYEAKLAAAADEARGILAQAQKDAEKSAARIISEAEQAAQRERARATAEIDAARTAALDEITNRSVDLAVLMANRIVRKQLSASDHQQLISEALAQFTNRN